MYSISNFFPRKLQMGEKIVWYFKSWQKRSNSLNFLPICFGLVLMRRRWPIITSFKPEPPLEGIPNPSPRRSPSWSSSWSPSITDVPMCRNRNREEGGSNCWEIHKGRGVYPSGSMQENWTLLFLLINPKFLGLSLRLLSESFVKNSCLNVF